MLEITGRACAAALLLVFGWAATQASAQLLSAPLPGSLVVTVTSPPSGSRVTGPVTVDASVTGPLGVAGVQFKLDGASLGAEDASAPYSVSWNTAGAGDGWHTLTAVARDASGLQFSSDPVIVRVSNTPPPSVPVTRFEETHPSVTFSPGWTQGDNAWPWSGGSTAWSRTPGARVTFSFTGTSVTWIGYRSSDSGIARVFVDGIFVSDVDLFARLSSEIRVPAFTVTGLTNSSHTLTIEVTGLKNQDAVAVDTLDPRIIVDAFDVPGPPVSRLQDTDPSVSYTAGWTGGDLSKPAWSAKSATLSTTPGARATLTFNGTSVGWIGYRGPDTGTARVFLDGMFAGEIDTYSPTERVQDVVFTATGLTDASHTLAVEVTGSKNAASTGTLIAVDAFDVTSPGTRFEETDRSVAFAGDWVLDNRNRAWSEGSIAESQTAGARATFSFTGTSVKWIGARASSTGIARVYLDGSFVAEIDTYSPTAGLQNTIFTASGLPMGTHTLMIEVTGRKNPASNVSWIVVDAFDVRP
jgi:hypothetical protein